MPLALIRKIFGVKKFPTFGQWKKFLFVLSPREKFLFLSSACLFLSAAIFLSIYVYLHYTYFQPARGGSFTEGVVGQPRWINPAYSSTNDVDRDLVELIFSGLLKYDINGEIIPDLAENYSISENGTIYEFYLKKNISWHDGKKFTADDVVFTIETLQNSDYKSPLLANWLGVKIKKISDYQVRFELKKPYTPFLEIAALKILPKHIWQDIPSQRFSLSPYNLKPIGTGPYKFTEITQNKLRYTKSITLEANKKYFGQKPFISEINFLFFNTQEELVKAAKGGLIEGLTVLLPQELNFTGNFISHLITIPRYFTVFFNQEKTNILAQSEIRYALNYGTNKEELIERIFKTEQKQPQLAEVIQSPLLPSLYGYSSPSNPYQYNPEKAMELLEKSGFKDVNGDGRRERVTTKENSTVLKSDLKRGSQGLEVSTVQACLSQEPGVYPEKEISGFFGPATEKAVIKFQEKYYKEILEPSGLKKGTGLVGKSTRDKLNALCRKVSTETTELKLSLATADQQLLTQTAMLLKEQWQKLGIEVNVQTFALPQLEKDVIKKREYELLLFGEVLGAVPDLFPFWHSSQRYDPGFNLALYNNAASDKLLEAARETLDPDKRAESYEKFQEQLLKEAPAVFLYNPSYLYLATGKVKGIDLKMIVDPSKRFSGAEKWYIKTKRRWK